MECAASFRAAAPDSYLVIVQLRPVGADSVQVVLTHTGWGRGEEWKALYAYFDRAWGFCPEQFWRNGSARGRWTGRPGS